jgi:predicted GIY-YIG superfamily endonuclease
VSKLSDYKRGVYIYALRLVDDEKIVYVGLTDEPARRLLEHALFFQCANIEMMLLEKYRDFKTACKAERRWIVYFSKLNPDMWNSQNIKKDHGSLDIQVNLRDVRCITIPMAEAVFDYRGITMDQYMFDCATAFPIHGRCYTFAPRPFVKKIMKSWDVCWQDIPHAIELHCRLAFDAMGMDGDWGFCFGRVMNDSCFSASDVFNSAVLLAHYGNFGLPERGNGRQEISWLRKLLVMTYDELYNNWPMLHTKILMCMPGEVKVWTEGFKDIEVFEGTINPPRVHQVAPQAQKVE